MKLGFSTLGCPEWTLEQIARNAAACGFDGVELRVAEDGLHLRPDASADELRRVREVFSRAGASIFALSAYTSYASADGRQVRANQDLTRRLMALGAALGAGAVRCYGGKPEGEERSAVAARIAAALRPLAKEAADGGIVLALETHTVWSRGADLMQIVGAVDSPGLGVVFDLNNTFADTGEWRETYRLIRPRIAYCHVKDDYVGIDGKRHHVMLGAGDLPLGEMLGQLKRDGFAGYLSYEWEKRWEPELAPPEQVFPHYVHKVRSVWGQ
jgi:sugar phosphate isomerase/epimerase